MMRIVVGVIVGFVAWATAWFGSEAILSALLPAWYGAPQRAFQAALVEGGEFTAATRLLVTHLGMVSIVSLFAGVVAALVAREGRRAPLALGLLLTAFGVLKAAMSWPYVPLWYHALFTALLLPMTLAGGRSKLAKHAA